MSDMELTQHLMNLAEAIRDVPEGDVHGTLVKRFGALLRYLESKSLVGSGQWNLGSRQQGGP